MLLASSDRVLSDIVLAEVPEQPPEEIEAVEVELVEAEIVEAQLVEIEPVELSELAEDLEPEIAPPQKCPAVRAMPILEDADRLAQQGIPLGSGLRAIADELHSGRNATAIRALADRLDAGDSLHEAMVKLRFVIPSSLSKLLEAGVSTGRFSVLLHQLVQLEQERRQLWQKSFSAIAYPAFLLSFLAAISMTFGLLIVPGFIATFADFGTSLPVVTKLVLSFFGFGQWVLWGVLVIFGILYFAIDVLPLPRFVKRTIYWLPLIGPIRRWHRLARCTRLMALLTGEQVPLPSAIRIAAEGAGRNEVTQTCYMAAKYVEHGVSFSDAADHLGLFPPSCASIICWGGENNALPEALGIVSEIAKTRMQASVDLLNAIACPVVLLIFLFTIPIAVIGMFMPLICLITTLS